MSNILELISCVILFFKKQIQLNIRLTGFVYMLLINVLLTNYHQYLDLLLMVHLVYKRFPFQI
ncbi:hypothetical protein SAMN04488089_12710 [Myroides profundi]|uniref:Uncharacterized protein n=1 Tax=Myroides profundi TaxID=480520 RepID=A0AAJ4W761_MYRPR|nr:hypothetical protein SAMN04488089_12710 [Myroides profundi]